MGGGAFIIPYWTSVWQCGVEWHSAQLCGVFTWIFWDTLFVQRLDIVTPDYWGIDEAIQIATSQCNGL